jgi:tetratricopeptide (TPR) repeat protein
MFQQVSSGIPDDARSVDVQLVLHHAHVRVGARNGDEALLGQFLQPGPDLKQVRRFDEAITACQDAAAIFRDTGDRHGEGLALAGPGRALDEAGRSREAMTAYRDAIAIYRETGDQYREGITRDSLTEAFQAASATGERAARTLGETTRAAHGQKFYNLSDMAMRT